jgi:hypothetical protein
MSQLKPVVRALRKIQPTMIQCASPTGSGYDEEWALKLQPGMTYHSVVLRTNLKHVPTIKRVTLDIGGTPVCYASNVMMNVIDDMTQKFKETGVFVFDFSKYEYRSPAGIFQTQLVTNIGDDVTLLIEFDKKGANDPTIPTLKAKAWVTDNDNAGRMYTPSRYELTQYSAAAGEHTWAFPNGSPHRHIQRIIFKEDMINISKIVVKRGARAIHTIYREDLDYDNQRYGEVALQDGYCLLDFTLFGFGSNGAMNTAGLSFEFEVDGAGAIKTYVEGFEQVAFPQRAA